MKANNSVSKKLHSEIKLLRKQNTKLIEKELAQQASFVDQNPDPVIKTDYSGKIVYANPASVDLFGKRLLEKSIITILPDLKKSHLKKVTATKPLRIESTIKKKIFTIIVKKNIQTKSFYIFGSDITAIRETERAFEESRNDYKNLVEDSPLLICKLDTKGHFTYLNKRWEETLGYTTDEMIGHLFTEFKQPEEAARTYKTSRKVVNGTKLKDYKTTYIAKDGREIILNIKAAPISGLAGNVTGALAIAEDITERRKTEIELKKSEEKLNLLME